MRLYVMTMEGPFACQVFSGAYLTVGHALGYLMSFLTGTGPKHDVRYLRGRDKHNFGFSVTTQTDFKYKVSIHPVFMARNTINNALTQKGA